MDSGELAAARRECGRAHARELAGKAVVNVSFEDALRGNLTGMIPVLKASKLPVTVFVPTAGERRGRYSLSKVELHPELLPEPYRRSTSRSEERRNDAFRKRGRSFAQSKRLSARKNG